MAIQLDSTLRTTRADAITTRLGNASLIRIYSGTIPANVAASITGTLLAELTGGSPFASGATAGVLTASAITQDSSADNTGTASHFRHWQSNGTTGVLQGTVGTSGADLNLNTTSIVATGPVAVSSYVLTEGGA